MFKSKFVRYAAYTTQIPPFNAASAPLAFKPLRTAGAGVVRARPPRRNKSLAAKFLGGGRAIYQPCYKKYNREDYEYNYSCSSLPFIEFVISVHIMRKLV